MAISRSDFKAALGRWASGVTIVTARHGDRIHGMTVSAFCSVSLEPPLILICADNRSETKGLIDAGKTFAVNILAAGQQELSNRFASKEFETRRFEGLEEIRGELGLPLIPGALCSLECIVTRVHLEGDHTIFIGQVEHVRTSELDPLSFYRGSYGSFA